MLLLMVQPEGDQLREAGLVGSRSSGSWRCRQPSVASDLVDAGSREEAALGPRMAGTHRLVVRVEDVGVGVVDAR